MNPKQLTIIIVPLLLVAFVFSPISALAHVENHMPDSVAEMEYRILLEFKPKDIGTRIKLAIVLMNQNKLAEAEKEFFHSLAASPDNLQANIGLSQLRLKRHKISDALEIIKDAIEISPDTPAVYLNYGIILETANRHQEAQLMYEEGLGKLANNPNNPEAEHDRQQLENALKKIKDKITKINSTN